MRNLLFAATALLLAVMSPVMCAFVSSSTPVATGRIETKWTIPLDGTPDGHGAGFGDMFYIQIDGHTVAYNVTTQTKVFDKVVSGRQVQGFLALPGKVLIKLEDNTMAFSDQGKFLWDSGSFTAPSNVGTYRAVGSKLYVVQGFSLSTIDLNTGLTLATTLTGGVAFDGPSTMYAVISDTNDSFFTKFNLLTGETARICGGAGLWGVPLSVSGDLIIFNHMQQHGSSRQEFVSRSVLTCAVVTTSGGLPLAPEGLPMQSFGNVVVSGGKISPITHESLIEVRLIANLSHVVSSFNIVTEKFLGSLDNGDLFLLGSGNGLSAVNGQTGSVQQTAASLREIPTCFTSAVISLGSVVMVPNLQGYNLFNSSTLEYLSSDETSPPSDFSVYNYDGVYITAIGSNLVGWVSTFPAQ